VCEGSEAQLGPCNSALHVDNETLLMRRLERRFRRLRRWPMIELRNSMRFSKFQPDTASLLSSRVRCALRC
jgi:hypothetical protein